MESPEHQERAIRQYMEIECHDEDVDHVEKVASERVFETRYDVWDVHTDKGRWWVTTNPTNLYYSLLSRQLACSLGREPCCSVEVN